MSDAEVLDRLRSAPFEIEGRMPWSSNGTFLVNFGSEDERAIYKPLRGERPLWDFPEGLYRREVAAYELSVALGWELIPPTVVREEAELGVGSLQHFVDADFEQHHFTLVEDQRHHDQLRRMCAFDVLANNTDRKSGHCLVDDDGHIWGIDNGLCFSPEFKLRTVIWEFGGERLPVDVTESITAFLDSPTPAALRALLLDDEDDALRRRASALLASGTFPIDSTGHRYPWPLV